MAVDIGKKYLGNLMEKRALVRQALQKHNLAEFPVFVLNKEDSIVSVNESNNGTCYECNSRIKAGEGLKLKITEKKSKNAEEYWFHKYHLSKTTRHRWVA